MKNKEEVDLLKDEENELEKTQEAIKKMKAIIKVLMPQIPYFRGYFNILEMITFSIHYISTLDANAVYPNFSESLLFKSNNKSYVTLLPPVFPPLPIKKQKIIEVKLTFSYVINNFLNNIERNLLNSILSESTLHDSEINFQKIEEILNTLENKYNNYLYNLIDDKDDFEYRTKKELHFDKYISNIQIILKCLTKTPKLLYIKLFKSIKESLINIIKENKKNMNFDYTIMAKKYL